MSELGLKGFLTTIRVRLQEASELLLTDEYLLREGISTDHVRDILGGVIGDVNDYETRLPERVDAGQDPTP